MTLLNTTGTLTLPLSIFPAPIRRTVTAVEKAMTRSRHRAELGLCTPEESASFCARTESSLRIYLDAQLVSGVITPSECAALDY